MSVNGADYCLACVVLLRGPSTAILPTEPRLYLLDGNEPRPDYTSGIILYLNNPVNDL